MLTISRLYTGTEKHLKIGYNSIQLITIALSISSNDEQILAK